MRLPFPHSEWWRDRATLKRMRLHTLPFVVVIVSAVAPGRAFAQPPAPEPEAPWEIKLGASFVGTSGNSDTASSGASFEARRQWDVWRLDASASAVRTSQDGEQTAEQYLGAIRAKRRLTDRIAATSGLKLERDRLAGLDFRSLLDGGLAYILVARPAWKVDGLSTLVWSHEDRLNGEVLDEAAAALEVASRYLFGTTAETTQRFTFYPNFSNSEAYRSEAELMAQASLNRRLALKFSFLWRYAHDPVPGFLRSDTTTTASIVVRWRAPAPAVP